MQIQIITNTVTTKPTARGSYQELEVVYKNLTFQGKVESKKIMSFGAGANSFKALAEASAGTTWEITVVKNDKGYNDWTVASPSDGVTQAATQAVSKAATTPAPRSNYETPEERAQRQVLIVRQSSLSSAVAMLTAGAKTPPKVEDVLALASRLEGFVFGIKDPGPTGFDDLPNFEEAEVN